VALSPSEITLLEELKQCLDRTATNDELLLRYYMGRQRVEQLGMAIPPAMRRFLVVTNWCRTVVDTINDRQQIRALILPGEETADPVLRAIWDANNLEAHVAMFNRDRMIYGRAFMSVGANEDDPSLPYVRVESPREMVAQVDKRREVVTAAARFYGKSRTGAGPTHVTLYQPDQTVWLQQGDDFRWVEVDRNVHGFGEVPVVMHLNRRMTGSWDGESQMSDIIPLVDSAARSLTNLQFAQEAHGIPRMWMTGVAKGDFLDAAGVPIPQFEAYFDAIHTLTSTGAKVGQLTAADLKNFETALNIYGAQASVATGFPLRKFGISSVNPPTEGSIRAEETDMVRSVEAQNTEVGVTVGQAAALALRFVDGREVPGDRVHVDWFDASTPTVSQREDALAKRRAAGVLSREGYWDELGWSEPRKAKERAYFEAEALDPLTRALTNEVTASAGAGAAGGA
jgi:Phage portal protein, SPP1 Gp6-like